MITYQKTSVMDVAIQTYRSPINSLFSLVIDYIVNNLTLYINENDEKLSILPSHIKNRILRRFTTSAYFWRNLDFKTVLASIVNEQTLSINLMSTPLDDEILRIISKCRNVQKLYLSRTKDVSITSTGLVNLLCHCPNLVQFVLSQNTEINDVVLECIADNCPNLMGLDIGGGIQVTDCGIQKISRLKNLSWVTFSSTQITDAGILSLVNGPSGSKLKELRIENTRVTDVGLKAIAANCSNLEILSFYSRKRRDDLSCPMFENELKNLKQLTWTVNW